MIVRFSCVIWIHLLLFTGLAGFAQEYSQLDPEQQLKEIDAQLRQLANYSLGSGIGPIGYRSQAHSNPDHPEWLQIDFQGTFPLDEVVLVPAISRDAINGFREDGFPGEFRLVAGLQNDPQGKVIAEYTSGSGILPRLAPLVIPCRGTMASWIRIEARTLSSRAFDEKYVLQLSEVLAFSGPEDVALRKPVTASSHTNNYGWSLAHVVDGILPYLMNCAQGKRSVAFLSPDLTEVSNLMLTVDLGASYPIGRLHLFAADQSDTVPQAFAGDFGIPRLLRIEGANQPDFADAQELTDLRHDSLYDVGPIIMRTFPETTCRYVRLRDLEPSANELYRPSPDRLGFAEIEMFSHGTNVALHRPVTANFIVTDSIRRLGNLTDGLNFYGKILPVRIWLEQLALRHELESRRPRVVAQLNQRYARQKAVLKALSWLTMLLALSTVAIILYERVMRQRAIERTRKRIAANLHDEMGADLHAIGLLCDIANASKGKAGKLDDTLRRMRTLTERTAKAVRYCTNTLEAKELYGNLASDMRRISVRILADLHHELEFEGEAALEKVTPQKRIDLLLFYQECLINIIRHSGANSVQTRVSATGKGICMDITDDGKGLDGRVPDSLKRRARLLGANVQAHPCAPRGTRIHLQVKLGRFRFLK